MNVTLYDGEPVRIRVVPLDSNGSVVGIASVTSATIDLYDPLGNYVFTNQPLTWSSILQYWYYDWSVALPGTFTVVATFNSPSGEVFEYGTVRVKSLKVTPTGLPTSIVGQEDNNGG